MDHELATPTGMPGHVFQDTIRPPAESMENIVGELLGNHADEHTVRLCVVHQRAMRRRSEREDRN